MAIDSAAALPAASMTAAPSKPRVPHSAKSIAIDIVLNVALPYGAYLLLRQAGQSEGRALVASALVPAAVAVASLLQRGRVNGLSLLVIGATMLSLAASAISGSAWFALIRPSFVTGAIALVFLLSLAAKRPTLFYLARDTMCPTAEEARAFETNWQSAAFRRSMRRLTLVWAAFLGGEAIFRAGLAAIWPQPDIDHGHAGALDRAADPARSLEHRGGAAVEPGSVIGGMSGQARKYFKRPGALPLDPVGA